MKPYLLGLAIFVITLIANFILVTMQYIYFGEVALAIVAIFFGIVYMNTIKKNIIARDMLKASLVVYLGFIGLRMLPYLSYPQDSISRALVGALAGGLVSFIIVYVILALVYSFFTSKNKQESTQVYSVTDHIIANQLIEVLFQQNIQAYSTEDGAFDSLTNTSHSNAISIKLNDKSQYQKALALIEEFFQNLDKREPWTCPQCNENIEGNFQACWSCGYEQE